MYQAYVVDDDKIILEAIIKTIPWMDNGFEVIGYSTNPMTAIKEISSLVPEVVFCDLQMPIMDGNEMIRQIKELNIACEFVMLSSYGRFEDSRTFFLQNGFDYILKPLELGQIQLVLERLSAKLAQNTQKTVERIEGCNSVFTELITYIIEHFNQRHTLTQLGERFNLNPNYICNLFAKHYNTTLTCFITKLRMEEAAKQIQDKNVAFKEVATDCGYSDYYYFCKVFKEYFGMSPTLYRRQYEQQRRMW